jgi:uncharacterized membrane protein
MDLYMVTLRFVHIGAGVFWAGAVFFVWLFLLPTVRAVGPDGAKFMQTLTRVTKLATVLPLSALATIVSGLLMFWSLSSGLSAAWLVTPSGMVLSVGALIGTITFVLPGMRLLRINRRVAALGQVIAQAGGTPTEEQLLEMRSLQGRIPGLYNKIGIMLTISVTCMATFRYL